MDETKREVTQGNTSVYAERDVNIHYANGKKIPKHLGTLPIIPDVFLGRDADLTIVHDKLFAGNNLLLLVNGEGGIGKTTFASRYYHQYADEYAHVGWVFAEKSISDAMLTLANALQLTFDEQMNAEERLQELLRAMAELKKPCLLVIDNANTLDDLAAHYHALHCCSNFHLLLTTRITEFEHAEQYPINALDEENAIKLFTIHYTAYDPAENELLKEILTAVGYNTLVIELFAKNLRALNRHRQRYTLRSLLTDLQSKGLFALSQRALISTTYKSTSLRKEKPEDILAAMYNLGELDEDEKALLSVFAVLPAEPVAFSVLDELLPNMESFEDTLTTLATKGWIEHNNTSKTYKCCPVVQETTRKQNGEKLFENCELLISTLIDKLIYQPNTGHLTEVSYDTAALYAKYAESILQHINKAKVKLAIIAERVGNYHITTGNLDKALTFYIDTTRLFEKLNDAFPDNVSFKNGLAISYEKLGETHTELGNLSKALTFYADTTRLFEELYEAYPSNVALKKGLAISYSKLGETHATLGNLDKALTFYVDTTRLFEELHDAFPNNVSFKNGLAISYEKLGETHAKRGNLGNALTFYVDYSQLAKELYFALPCNVSFKHELAVSYSKLGDTHAALGNHNKALPFYVNCSHLSKELYDTFPNNISFKKWLAISYQVLGNTHAAPGNFNKALRWYEQFLQLMKELYEAYPSNVSFKNGLAISYEKLGNTHAALGNLDKALTFYEDCSHLSKELYTTFPNNIAFKHELSDSYIQLGLFYRNHSQDTVKALSYFQQAEALLAELTESAPGYIEFLRNLSNIRSILSELPQS